MPWRVLDQADAVVLGLVASANLSLRYLRYIAHAILDGAAGEVVVEPVHVAAIVGDAVVETKGLGDEAAALVVKGEADGIGQQRLGRPQGRRQPWSETKTFDGQLPLGRRPGNGRGKGLLPGCFDRNGK